MRRLCEAVVILVLLGSSVSGQAKVYFSRTEAVAGAFPGADRVEEKTWLLNDGQVNRIEKLAHERLATRIARVYVGFRGDQLLGFAMIDINTVRNLPEAFLVVVSPTGGVERIQLLAFYEPEEYAPSPRWLSQFDNRGLTHNLRLRGSIHGIAGSTLTARAVTGGVRRVLAVCRVLYEKQIADHPAKR